MKRHIAIFLAFFYLLFSTGLVVNTHFCGDKLSGISFFQAGKGCCCGKEMKKKSCCKDEISNLKISDTHQSSENLRISPLKIIFLSVPTYTYNSLLINKIEKKEVISFTDSSPPPNNIPIFLRDCVFLI
jgi:hypothetical protein